ncbi:MAG: DUF6525 family protein [Pseudomonadota bacterium]
MPRNLGQTRLRKRRRNGDPMREFDQLPAVLRGWLAEAALPWRPRSVLRAYNRALAQCGEEAQALAELDRLQTARLETDARQTGASGSQRV